jgi:hypothetical protein
MFSGAESTFSHAPLSRARCGAPRCRGVVLAVSRWFWEGTVAHTQEASADAGTLAPLSLVMSHEISNIWIAAKAQKGVRDVQFQQNIDYLYAVRLWRHRSRFCRRGATPVASLGFHQSKRRSRPCFSAIH